MTTGAGSSFPLTRLAARYNDSLKNGQLLSNKRVVDLIDERIIQLAGRVDVDEAPERVGKLYKLWQEFRMYQDSQQKDKELIARIQLDVAFEKVFHDYAAWGQIFEAIDLRGKTAEREVKILKEIRGIISVEDAYEMLAQALAATIRVLGDDPKRLKQVQYEYARLIGEVSDNVTEGTFAPDGGGDGEGGS